MDTAQRAPVVIGVDTGGTFTDVFTSDGNVVKVPSTPRDPAEAIFGSLRAVGVQPGDAVAHGTTVATNAVLERKGARTALITTAGFEDVLEIRRQNRPELYDLFARWPEPLVPACLRFGASERLDYKGHVLRSLDPADVRSLVDRVVAARVDAIAICLLFAYVDSAHERLISDALEQRLGSGFPLALSHRVAPRYGEYERTSTTVVNAYVLPVMGRYLRSLEEGLTKLGIRQLHVMHSNGGLLSARSAAEIPVHTVLSGPSAGVVGARALAARAGRDHIISFDMGGTSTDVAVVPGEILEGDDGEIGTFPLVVPMLRIETVGAGGGSIARVDAGGGLHVGPESAGADPGPAAYGHGHQPTVTDANLILGRLSARGLLGGQMPLSTERAFHAMARVARPLAISIQQAAWSVVRLANSNMERAVRTVTLQRGYDPRRFTLFPFGGAGPLHAAELADDLGIEEALVPPHPGVMAALGLTVPDLQRDVHRTVLLGLSRAEMARLPNLFSELEALARQDVRDEELFGEPVLHRFVDMRYVGQSFDLRLSHMDRAVSLRAAFNRAYERRYGYATPQQPVEIVNIRVRLTLPRLESPRLVPPWPERPRPAETRKIWFGSPVGMTDLREIESQVVWRPSLPPSATISGPAILEQYDSATLLPPRWTATVDPSFNLILARTT